MKGMSLGEFAAIAALIPVVGLICYFVLNLDPFAALAGGVGAALARLLVFKMKRDAQG
jgi:hypothetical protein